VQILSVVAFDQDYFQQAYSMANGGVMNNQYLYEVISRVPVITDEQIAEMRHIEPVLKDGMCRRIKGIEKVHPRDVSFLWDAEPTGDEFTFDSLNMSTIITQHRSAVFFKPSLAEVYAWIRVYLPEEWRRVRHFHMGECQRLGASSDVFCQCLIMGGDMLVKGNRVTFPSGAIGHELVKGAAS
jgi:hypothetical protein